MSDLYIIRMERVANKKGKRAQAPVHVEVACIHRQEAKFSKQGSQKGRPLKILTRLLSPSMLPHSPFVLLISSLVKVFAR